MKILVAISGGVDSSLAAAFLVEAGHDVTGIYLDCWSEPGCKVDLNRKDAMRVGLKLKIPMKVLDFKKEYEKRVMDWFFTEVKKGRTPNPDVFCNKEIKFGLLSEWAMKQGFDKLATGHYARIVPAFAGQDRLKNSTNAIQHSAIGREMKLLRAVDEKKDQSYFLSLLKQRQLEKVMFPVGGITKDEVRKKAKKRGIHVWNKRSTSGICFIGHTISFEDLLKTRIKEHKGEVIDIKGKVIGKHKGHQFYTIGQRHGFEVKQTSSNSKALFVVSKDRDKNQLVVGEKKELLRDSFEVEGWSCIRRIKSVKGFLTNDIHHSTIGRSQRGLRVRIRHQGKLIGCVVDGNKVRLKEKVFGVAPGQVAVIYQGEECLGGGVIKS